MNMSHLIKNLYIINGPMGVGKTTVSQGLLNSLDHCVFLDGDWCWDMHPFIVNNETKKIVMNNIVYCLNNFIHSTTYQNIIFCWVIPTQEILDTLIDQLDLTNVCLHKITLVSNQEQLIKRIKKDIDKGIRKEDVIERSLQYLDGYHKMDTIHIDVSYLSIDEIIDIIQMN